MPDASVVDAALVTRLQRDAILAAWTPDGWYLDEAPAGRTQFGIVSLVDEHDVPMFEGRAFEDALYLVKVVELSTVPVRHARAAAARIDVVLGGAPLTADGYRGVQLTKEARLRVTETDDRDATIVWAHRGGYFRVVMQPQPAIAPTADWIAPGWISDRWAA